MSNFIGMFLVSENDISCRLYDRRLNRIPPGRWAVLEATPYTWKLVAPGYGAEEDPGKGPVYLSKEHHGKDLPNVFVREPGASIDLMWQIMALDGDPQKHLDAAIQMYLDRQQILAEWRQASNLDDDYPLGLTPEQD